MLGLTRGAPAEAQTGTAEPAWRRDLTERYGSPSAVGSDAPAATTAIRGATEPAPRPDPFSRDTISDFAEQQPGQRPFIPAATLPNNIPRLTLLGLAKTSASGPVTALLNVEGLGSFVIREGETISLQRTSRLSRTGAPVDDVLRIKTISELSVTVEVGTFGEVIVVR
ncbi:MAG: hypothetical protein AAGC57_13840 [Pseudomonadota bacterium]